MRLANATQPRTHSKTLHLVLQLYSYPGDYVSGKPTVERMAETIEKYDEDLQGVSSPKGKRSAIVRFGKPIAVQPFTASRPRVATGGTCHRSSKKRSKSKCGFNHRDTEKL